MAGQARRSKLYTRGGDAGDTSLLGGRRVPKDHPRIGAYGAVDELNAVLGVAISFIKLRKVAASVESFQRALFSIGAELANETKRRARNPGNRKRTFDPAKTRNLEALIDEYDARVPPLRNFVLPSGSSAAAFLHQARTVCRRAERQVVALSRTADVDPAVLTYLNRLSDLLFVLARYLNKAD